MRLGTGIVLAGLCAVVATGAIAATEVAPDKVMIHDMTVAQSLTGVPGNPEEGANAFKDRRLGNCLACHQATAMSKELFHGNVGPSLDGVASRYSTEQLRAIIVNAKEIFGPDSMMPGFYTLNVGAFVDKKREGQTILSAQQVEDIVAYLQTMKE